MTQPVQPCELPDGHLRLVALGVRPGAISVTGDTRYDQVWERGTRVDRSSVLLGGLVADRPTLVAGSTRPADEEPLLAAWLRVRAALPNARLIIAPHEPTAAHLAPIESQVRAAGLRLARLGASDAPDADVLLADRTGVLGDLYALADAAFVGGGFHAAGLHSVLEPAAFGSPVLFRPRYTNSRDARLPVAARGGISAADAAAIQRHLAVWLGDPAVGAEAGGQARALVRSGLGVARRSFDLVVRLLP